MTNKDDKLGKNPPNLIKNNYTGLGFPMGSTINNISYKDIVAKSLQFQKNSFSNGLIKNNYTGLGFPMGSTINNISYKDIVAKSLQSQKNSFSNGLIKNNYTGLGFSMGSTINNISYKDIVAKSLQFQKNSFSNGLIKNNYTGLGFSMGSTINKTVYKNLFFNKLAIPKTHIDLLYREDIHSDFTSTKNEDNNIYLQVKDSSDFIDIEDIKNSYAIYDEKLGVSDENLGVSDENLGFSKSEIFDFIKYSEQYPMLILNNNVGKALFNEIQKFKIEEYITSDKIILYRTRPKKDEFPFANDELLRPPYDISKGGRFDSYGTSVLYTAQTKEISLLESYDDTAFYYHIKKFCYDNTLKLADLSKLDKTFLKILLRPPERNNAQEYIIPRFISQCINIAGYDGFVIHSSKGKNNELNFNFFGDPSNALTEIDYTTMDKSKVDLLIREY